MRARDTLEASRGPWHGRPRRPALRLLTGLTGLAGIAGIAWIVLGPRRLVVEGASMEPTLLAGDHVLATRCRKIREGDVVLARDPREQARIVVKRVVALLGDGSVLLVGDNLAASTDSRHFGPVARQDVIGRVTRCYFPPERAGTLPRSLAGLASRV